MLNTHACIIGTARMPHPDPHPQPQPQPYEACVPIGQEDNIKRESEDNLIRGGEIIGQVEDDKSTNENSRKRPRRSQRRFGNVGVVDKPVSHQQPEASRVMLHRAALALALAVTCMLQTLPRLKN